MKMAPEAAAAKQAPKKPKNPPIEENSIFFI
jgi:hypothetical protein